MKKQSFPILPFLLIVIPFAVTTYLIAEDVESIKPEQSAPPVIKFAPEIPATLKEKLIEQILKSNTILLEASATLDADAHCSTPPDPEQIDILSRKVRECLDQSYPVLKEAGFE